MRRHAVLALLVLAHAGESQAAHCMGHSDGSECGASPGDSLRSALTRARPVSQAGQRELVARRRQRWTATFAPRPSRGRLSKATLWRYTSRPSGSAPTQARTDSPVMLAAPAAMAARAPRHSAHPTLNIRSHQAIRKPALASSSSGRHRPSLGTWFA